MKNLPSVTLQDVAVRVGVSASTVSRALRDHPKISITRRRQIQSIAREMGFTPNAMAVGLVKQREQIREHSVGAEIAWLNLWQEPARLRSYREFDAYWRGAFKESERSGYRLEEFAIDSKVPAKRVMAILESRNIQGIILPPHGHASNAMLQWTDFCWDRFSVVRFGYSLAYPPVDVVTANQIYNGMTAFEKVARHGYRRVGFVVTNPTAGRFQAGFLLAQTLAESGVEVATLWLDERNPSAHSSQVRQWIQANRLEVIVTSYGRMRQLLDQIGIRVPGDMGLAVTSVLDGDADAGIFQNSTEVGRMAVETLLTLIHNNHRGIPPQYRETLVQGWWQDGETLPPR